MNNKRNSEEYQVRKQLAKISLGYLEQEIYDENERIIQTGGLTMDRKYNNYSHPVIQDVFKYGCVRGYGIG